MAILWLGNYVILLDGNENKIIDYLVPLKQNEQVSVCVSCMSDKNVKSTFVSFLSNTYGKTELQENLFN